MQMNNKCLNSQVQNFANQPAFSGNGYSDCEPLWNSRSSLGSEGAEYSLKVLQLNKIYVIGVPPKVANS